VYESAYDFMHNLHASQMTVNTKQEKQIVSVIVKYLWQELVHEIVREFVRQILLVDSP
jgi:hypothetical protein